MKFAKELDREAVPEWRSAYLEYKKGKKLIKAIARAQNTAWNTSDPSLPARPRRTSRSSSVPDVRGIFPTTQRRSSLTGQDSQDSPNHDRRGIPSNGTPNTTRRREATLSEPTTSDGTTAVSTAARFYTDEIFDKSYGHLYKIPSKQSNHRTSSVDRFGEPFTDPENNERAPLKSRKQLGMQRYGSIIGSPPSSERTQSESAQRKLDEIQRPESISLPGPAMDPDQQTVRSEVVQTTTSRTERQPEFSLHPSSSSPSGNAYEVGRTKFPTNHTHSLPHGYRNPLTPKRTNSSPNRAKSIKPLFRRVFSMGVPGSSVSPGGADVSLRNYQEVELREKDFFRFLDSELEKTNSFFEEKEAEASQRLQVLRQQLHMMRDDRLREITANRLAKKSQARTESGAKNGHIKENTGESSKHHRPRLSVSWPITTAVEMARNVRRGKPGKNLQALRDLATPNALRPQQGNDGGGDYSRRTNPEIPYRTAKRKLKTAFQEYYRGLELLKSFALVNQKAFKKLCKKFDKTLGEKIQTHYMATKVNEKSFVKSDVLERHIIIVEDLYARYFEQGNHKVAVSKLRINSKRHYDYSETAARSGVMLGVGLTAGILGLTEAVPMLDSLNRKHAVNTSYLLQIYAGYFLLVFLTMMFCAACGFWERCKINYKFVFEFDTRHNLNWRQLFELPCLFMFLLGIQLWLNFNLHLSDELYTWWPWILVGLTIIILGFPLPYLYHRSRRWFLYSCFRLAHPFLPVEFRDFFLGDMLCSLTYVMGNIEVFFCVYARQWEDPQKCNSRSSRLLGFMTTLPAIIRAIQCLRRVYDSGTAFPQLYNFFKYTATIMFYLSLSLYRLDSSYTNRILFIFFATINAVYCTSWDILIDWSFGDWSAKTRLLRSTLGFKSRWPYWIAITIDPILRFNWIFYAIYADDVQHSAVLSFFVSFSEVIRRGIWTLFRVENEHCSNVRKRRAHKDEPLPYSFTMPTSPLTHPTEETESAIVSPRPSADLEQARTRDSQRSGRFRQVGTMLQMAHRLDFERRKPDEEIVEDDSDEDDDDEDVLDDTESERDIRQS